MPFSLLQGVCLLGGISGRCETAAADREQLGDASKPCCASRGLVVVAVHAFAAVDTECYRFSNAWGRRLSR